MNMSERILMIIDSKGITKTEFADRLNITQAYVSKIINKGSIPSNRLIEDICEKFSINETWIRTGDGKMDRFIPEKDEAEALVSNLLGDGDNELYTLIKEIMRTYSQLDESSKTVLKEFSKNLLENLKRDPISQEAEQISREIDAIEADARAQSDR